MTAIQRAWTVVAIAYIGMGVGLYLKVPAHIQNAMQVRNYESN